MTLILNFDLVLENVEFILLFCVAASVNEAKFSESEGEADDENLDEKDDNVPGKRQDKT